MKSPLKHSERKADNSRVVFRELRAAAVNASLALLATAVVLAGCAGRSPRVTAVSHRTMTRTIPAEDEAVFVHDRASHFRVTPHELPAAQRRQEFYVRWTPATVATVRFQYRQARLPNELHEQTFAAKDHRTATFTITGDDFTRGGAVSAWRVSLWTDATQCVAEQRSATW